MFVLLSRTSKPPSCTQEWTEWDIDCEWNSNDRSTSSYSSYWHFLSQLQFHSNNFHGISIKCEIIAELNKTCQSISVIQQRFNRNFAFKKSLQGGNHIVRDKSKVYSSFCQDMDSNHGRSIYYIQWSPCHRNY